MIQGLMETALLWKGLGWLCSLAIVVIFLALLFPRPQQPVQKKREPHKDPQEKLLPAETAPDSSGTSPR